MRSIYLQIIFLLCFLAGAVAYAENPRVEPDGLGQVSLSNEYQVKAAMLYKITWFVRWETEDFINNKSPINLCLLEPDPFGVFLDQIIEGHSRENKRSLSITRIEHINDQAGLDGCHVLFIPKDSHSTVPLQRGLLIVTEDQVVTTNQAHINFVTNGGHVKFEVNIDNLEQSQIQISSKLLNLARVVRN